MNVRTCKQHAATQRRDVNQRPGGRAYEDSGSSAGVSVHCVAGRPRMLSEQTS